MLRTVDDFSEFDLDFGDYEEFDVVQVNHEGPFLSTKPINLSNPKEQATHLVEHKKIEKKELSIGTSKSKNVEHDSVKQKKINETIIKLEKITKYRLADIREAIRKKNEKRRIIEENEDHITYYNSSTKCIEGDSTQHWQFQVLVDHLNHTEASPSRIRDIFSWLKKTHSAFLPNLPVEDARVPKYSEEDLLCLIRLHIKDESLLYFDSNNRNYYFESIEHSLDRIEQNPYLILQYQLYTENTPKCRVKTSPATDGNLILDYYINKLINLNKLFLVQYPEIYTSVNSLKQNNFASTQDMNTICFQHKESSNPPLSNEESTQLSKKRNSKSSAFSDSNKTPVPKIKMKKTGKTWSLLETKEKKKKKKKRKKKKR